MLCTKNSFSALACVCFAAQVAALHSRISTNDLQQKNTDTIISRAADFVQKHARPIVTALHVVTSMAVAKKERRYDGAIALTAKDLTLTFSSSRGLTIAKTLSAYLTPVPSPSKTTKVSNFLKKLGKELTGNSLNGVIVATLIEDILLEYYLKLKLSVVLKDVFKDDDCSKLSRCSSLFALKALASSKSDKPLDRSFWLGLGLDAFTTFVNDRFCKPKTFWYLFLKNISYKNDGKRLAFKLILVIQKTLEQIAKEYCSFYCKPYVKDQHAIIKKLVEHIIASSIKTLSNQARLESLESKIENLMVKIEEKFYKIPVKRIDLTAFLK